MSEVFRRGSAGSHGNSVGERCTKVTNGEWKELISLVEKYGVEKLVFYFPLGDELPSLWTQSREMLYEHPNEDLTARIPTIASKPKWDEEDKEIEILLEVVYERI